MSHIVEYHCSHCSSYFMLRNGEPIHCAKCGHPRMERSGVVIADAGNRLRGLTGAQMANEMQRQIEKLVGNQQSTPAPWFGESKWNEECAQSEFQYKKKGAKQVEQLLTATQEQRTIRTEVLDALEYLIDDVQGNVKRNPKLEGLDTNFAMRRARDALAKGRRVL